jgi:hypothetical protein
MHWAIEHRFRELEGRDKRILNGSLPGLYLARALQQIDFRMDRKGALVGSEVRIEFLDGDLHGHYHYDRPFLVLMRKRGAKHPFFLMWVANAELLIKP